MDISRTGQSGNIANKGRQPAPATGRGSRALTVRDTFSSVSRADSPGAGAAPYRRSSAFLAHLALQYDGPAARRRQRAERLEAAIASYGARPRSRQRLRPSRDLRI